ncbi:MAG: glycosyltransferase [Planctomycetes bacterium]|nr:glycosyltransferase [Planctomycetota bacterium]
MPVTTPAKADRLRVCYILKMFPRLSETFILNEILSLERQGVEVSVISLMHPADGRFHGRLSELELTVDYLPKDKIEVYWERIRGELREFAPPLEDWKSAVRFAERHHIPKDLDLVLRSVIVAGLLRSRGVHHVHAHFATISTRVAALAHLMTGMPFSFTSHAKDIFRETVDRGLYRDLVELSRFNITVSDFNREYILEHTPGVDSEKIVRLYNGIDLDYFRPAEGPRDPNHIVSVGRLVPKKGFDVLLRAARELQERGSALHFTIVGDGEDRDALHALHRELGLGDRVRFVGALAQEEVRKLYGVAGLTALACIPDDIGNRDALPTTLLESLACGVPAVSTRLTGVPEIVTGTTGAIVEPGDADALARALAQMATEVDEPMRQRCRARAEELFDLHRNAGILRSHFERSVKESSRS